MLGEEALRRLAVLSFDPDKPAAVALQLRVIAVQATQDAKRHVPPGLLVGDAVVNPGPFGRPGYQAGFRQYLQVTRYPRLRLAKDLSELFHGALALRKQRQEPHASLIACRLELPHQELDRRTHKGLAT